MINYYANLTATIAFYSSTTGILFLYNIHYKLDGCIVWNAHNTVLGEEARLIYIVPVCYVKTGIYVWKNRVISLLVYTGKKFNYNEYSTNY